MTGRIHTVVALATLVTMSACGTQDKDIEETHVPALGDIILGSPDAPVEIIEYASVTCNHCRSFHNAVLPVLKKRFIDTGKAHFIVREFPTAPQALAAAGAALARCAGKDQYYGVLDSLFGRQYEIIDSASKGGALDVLTEIATAHGMTGEMVTQCWSNIEILEGIDATVEEGIERGVRGTPTIFINGEQIEPEDVNVDALSERIEKAFSQASPNQ